MVLIYIFSVLVISGTKSIKIAGAVLVSTTVAFFVFIVCLSMSVLAFSVPCNLAERFEVKRNACSIPLQQAAQEPPHPDTCHRRSSDRSRDSSIGTKLRAQACKRRSPERGRGFSIGNRSDPRTGRRRNCKRGEQLTRPKLRPPTTQNESLRQRTIGSRSLGSFGYHRPDPIRRKRLPKLWPASFRTPVRTIRLRYFAGSLGARNGTLSLYEPLVGNKPVVWQHSRLRTNSKAPIHSRIQAGRKLPNAHQMAVLGR